MKIIEGDFLGKGKKFAIVVSRFNDFFTKGLLAGAEDAFIRHGVDSNDIEVAWVPGAFEIPLISKKMAETKRYDAVIALGAIIKGSTPHFDFVAAEVSKGVAQVALQSEVPIVFGVLTTNNLDEAIERSGTKAGNKGFDAAISALELVNLIEKLK